MATFNDRDGIIFAAPLVGPAPSTATLAAAGSTQTDAAVVASNLCIVTAANGTKGVRLPPLAAVPVGTCITIVNTDLVSALKVYSDAAGELITGQAGTTAISLAAKLMLRCYKYDATNWYAEKGVLPY